LEGYSFYILSGGHDPLNPHDLDQHPSLWQDIMVHRVDCGEAVIAVLANPSVRHTLSLYLNDRSYRIIIRSLSVHSVGILVFCEVSASMQVVEALARCS